SSGSALTAMAEIRSVRRCTVLVLSWQSARARVLLQPGYMQPAPNGCCSQQATAAVINRIVPRSCRSDEPHAGKAVEPSSRPLSIVVHASARRFLNAQALRAFRGDAEKAGIGPLRRSSVGSSLLLKVL